MFRNTAENFNSGNLPVGCTQGDIDRAAGADTLPASWDELVERHPDKAETILNDFLNDHNTEFLFDLLSAANLTGATRFAKMETIGTKLAEELARHIEGCGFDVSIRRHPLVELIGEIGQDQATRLREMAERDKMRILAKGGDAA